MSHSQINTINGNVYNIDRNLFTQITGTGRFPKVHVYAQKAPNSTIRYNTNPQNVPHIQSFRGLREGRLPRNRIDQVNPYGDNKFKRLYVNPKRRFANLDTSRGRYTARHYETRSFQNYNQSTH